MSVFCVHVLHSWPEELSGLQSQPAKGFGVARACRSMDEDILPPKKKKSPLVLAGVKFVNKAQRSGLTCSRLQPHKLCPHAGAGVTAGVLIAGLMFFNKVRTLQNAWTASLSFIWMSSHSGTIYMQGNDRMSQHMMRARVIAQVRSYVAAAHADSCILSFQGTCVNPGGPTIRSTFAET